MNRKTNNRSGFTLVELIVVMCLMGLIMGAVLNLIRPTAELYTETNAYLGEEEATTSIYNFIKDDIMYATALCVVSTDIGDPTAAAASCGLNNSYYSNCIVLDNASVRTQGTEVAERKGATGSIKKYAYNGSTYVDVTTNNSLLAGQNLFNNSFSLSDQSFMEDDKYVFAVAHDPLAAADSITLVMDVYTPSHDETGYKYTYRSYSAKKGIEFINIQAGRVDDGPWYYTDTIDNVDMSNPSPYVYIFYNRKSKIVSNARQIPFECYVKNKDGDYWMCHDGKAAEGGSIAEDIATNADTQDVNMYVDLSAGYVYERTGCYSETPDEIYVDGEVYFDLRSVYTTSSTLKLYAVYKRTPISDMPNPTVRFYDNINGNGTPIHTKSVPFYGTLTDIPSPGTTTETGGVQTRWMWAELGTTIEHASFANILTDVNVYKCSYKAYKITFLDLDDNVITDIWTDDSSVEYDAGNYYVVEGQFINYTASAYDYMLYDADGNPINGTYTWEVVSPSGGDTADPVNSTMTLKVKYTPVTDTPVDPGTPDPGTPDPGTPDPGTPDPGTPDPGTPDTPSEGGVSAPSGMVVELPPYSSWQDGSTKRVQYNGNIKINSYNMKQGQTLKIVIQYDCNISNVSMQSNGSPIFPVINGNTISYEVILPWDTSNWEIWGFSMTADSLSPNMVSVTVTVS